MDIEQAKAKLDSISKSTATKHPKVLVAELCAVVRFLLDEIDRIKFPVVTMLSKRLPEDLEITRSPKVQPPWPNKPKPQFPSPNPSVLPSRQRKGNAGDAT